MDSYQITFQTWNKIAQLYQDRFMDLDMYDNSYIKFCALIPNTNARIFEIGCGPGNITRFLLQQQPNFQIDAIDVAPAMLELAKINNPTANFQQLDCREIDKIQQQYDAVIVGFCMPYLSKEDCYKLIKDSAALLSKDGVFYTSVIEDSYRESGYKTGSTGDKCYVYYHEESYLLDYLKEHNFKVVDTIRHYYTDTNNVKSTHLVIIAKLM